MNRRTICLPVLVAIVLLVCLSVGAGRVALANGDVPNEGTPRLTYATDFTPGTRVELLADAPDLGPGLKAGMTGIILCCDTDTCSGRVLVSWNLWRGGRDEEAACATAVAGLYPAGSATWVDPSKVRIGLPFDARGVIRDGEAGCVYLATLDGKVYRLLLTPEFRAKWWNVRDGAFFRVKGLLNTSPSADACAQEDGEVYAPIVIPYDWTERDSWDQGPFYSGDRVVLVGESNPYGATKLPRGATGTVICRSAFAKRSILVSWDLWNSTAPASPDENDYTSCFYRISGLYLPGSAWWVAPMDLARYYESGCGVLEQTTLCCGQNCPDAGLIGLFVPSEDVYCLPDISVDTPLPTGMVRAIGLYTPYEELMDPTAVTPSNPAMRNNGGIILDSLVVPCHIPSCCDPPYTPGDRVRLLVNQPGGAEGLSVGRGGTVVCCNPNDPITPILVSWDSWTNGGDEDELCQTTPGWYPENSALWMACTEIRHISLADLSDIAEYRRFQPQTLAVGKHLRISGMIANSGAVVSGMFTVSIYLSTDQTLTSSDILLGQPAYNMDAGAEVPLSWINPLPASVTPGTYYVGWVIDSGNQVVEEDENNNIVILDGQLTVTAE